MSRRANKHLRPPSRLVSTYETSQTKADGRWIIRNISADHSTKEYTCPGCGRVVPLGTPHIVVWPSEPPIGASSAVEFRRHWHSSCWSRRP